MHQVSCSERRLEEWLFQLLRFAITRESIDEAAAVAAAEILDAVIPGRASSFRYFTRTTRELSAAITHPRDQQTLLSLQEFVARIGNRRLRAAIIACLDLQQAAPRLTPRALWRTSPDLWRGLPKR